MKAFKDIYKELKKRFPKDHIIVTKRKELRGYYYSSTDKTDIVDETIFTYYVADNRLFENSWSPAFKTQADMIAHVKKTLVEYDRNHN